YEEPVTWTVEIAVPANEKPGKTELVGLIGLQTCSDQSCDLAAGARFQTSVAIGDSARGGPVSLSFQEAKYRDVAQRAAEQPVAASPAQTPAASVSVRMMAVLLGLAFVAGLILNLMPCVLPVIGLKVLSFVQQAGQDRRQVFLLNLWYALGILSVFMVLGTFAVVAHLGWGAQFSSPSTNITLACIVFVFALSFLGVWEIPIPGFVGSGAAQDLASREGPTGAFLKGVLTTVLATPCVGPFLGPTLTEAIKHPWFVTYPVFAFVGLGMASPYLIIGANPSLLKWIPKPGQWMDTFKQLMGFILLGTVVWIMSSIDWPRVVPTFALMIGLWASCWWIGRTPLTEPLGRRLYAWSSAAVFAVAMGYVSFNLIEPAMQGRFELALDKEVLKREELLASRGGRDANDRLWQLFTSEREDKLRQLKTTNSSELPWQPYSKSRLKMLQDHGYTVFVDFSAPWCTTCHVNEHNALNTLPTQKLVEDLNIITLDANVDDDESAQSLVGLAGAGQGVPYYIIYPAGKADAPVHMGLNAVLTQDETLTKLREAGASKPIAAGMTANDPPRDVRTTSAEFSATKTSAPFANQKNARE
ncbi:MAG TPA: cytochrome c biogenesis protein CcdA, partial [Pirellulales bacterium]|nr:cytochrome c biogenesis protein CcdA [Pirellulales bacterium]